MLKEEFNWFIENQSSLVQKYNGKVLVIKEREVVGSYRTEKEAYWDAVGKYELGTFLIQKCAPGPSAYTIVLHPGLMPA